MRRRQLTTSPPGTPTATADVDTVAPLLLRLLLLPLLAIAGGEAGRVVRTRAGRLVRPPRLLLTRISVPVHH